MSFEDWIITLSIGFIASMVLFGYYCFFTYQGKIYDCERYEGYYEAITNQKEEV